MLKLITPAYAEDVIGTITAPTGIVTSTTGTAGFINAIITFIIVVAGLFTLFQFITGGLTYITGSGDKNKVAEANNKIIYSIMGIAIIAGSFIIAGILGLILYGDFSAILNPKLISVQ